MYYDHILSEPMPERFRKLLERLERGETIEPAPVENPLKKPLASDRKRALDRDGVIRIGRQLP